MEIILRPMGFCNLSELVVRSTDTIEDLVRKARICTILGTFQSTLTDFKYLRPIWKQNAEEERLLGVSMTGIMDHPALNGSLEDTEGLKYVLDKLRESCVQVNKEWAAYLGIEQSAAITTVKPSGTVSQLVDSASGIHPRHAPYYIRTVRADVKDPLAIFLKDKGVPCEEDVTNRSNLVFSFPIRSPEGSVFRTAVSAIQQLEHYLIFKQHWCEHNPLNIGGLAR